LRGSTERPGEEKTGRCFMGISGGRVGGKRHKKARCAWKGEETRLLSVGRGIVGMFGTDDGRGEHHLGQTNMIGTLKVGLVKKKVEIPSLYGNLIVVL